LKHAADLLKVLHSKGAKVHADNHYALRWSTENGHLDIVKNLVKQGAGDHADNDYALIWSAKKGNLDIVKYLVEQGALGFTLSTRPRTQGIVSRTSFSDEEKSDLIPKDFDSSENKSLPMDSGMERWRKILLMKRNL
jgi:ankyrin repeat protein